MRLKELRKQKKITQKQLAMELNLDPSSISKYESEAAAPSKDVLLLIAKYFNVSVDYLLGNENKIEKLDNFIDWAKPEDFVKLPLVGRIACGVPILAVQNIEEFIDTPKKDLLQGEIYFYLRAKGNSMVNVGIFDGDLVLIRMQSNVNNGDIAVVLVDDEATLKRVIKKENAIILQPESNEFLPQIFIGEETLKIKIIGRLMEVKRRF